MKEPVSKNDTLKKIWEYECDPGVINARLPSGGASTSGGNVIELPDSSMFISMSSEYSKIGIVSRDKKMLWSAVPEQWKPHEKKWEIIPQYRASIITREELEKLIWNAGPAK